MSYERMWDPEPPSPEERLETEIVSGGGALAKPGYVAPASRHWAILRYGIFRQVPVTYVSYLDKNLWLAEVKRLAAAHATFTALEARPASAKVSVTVDVSVDEGAP